MDRYINHTASVCVDVWSRPLVVGARQRLTSTCANIVACWYGVSGRLLSHFKNVAGFDVTEAEYFRVMVRSGNGVHWCGSSEGEYVALSR